MKAAELWNKFCTEKGIDPNTNYVSWAFGCVPDHLASLVMLGVKTATASGYDFYALEPAESMPKEGDYSVILNSRDEAVCVIQTTRLYVSEFAQVSEEQARKEGEGDRSLAYWRRVHRDFFMQECEDYGLEFSDKFKVLCEEFECVYSLYEVNDMTEQEAREVCDWRYEGEYAVYNYPEWDECVKQGWSLTDEHKRRGSYYSVKKDGEFLAFFHIMERDGYVELGVGVKPEQCGNHHGNMLMNLALAKIEEKYGEILVQLKVRTFNKRAIKCYERVGFKIIKTYYEDKFLVPGEMHIMQKK